MNFVLVSVSIICQTIIEKLTYLYFVSNAHKESYHFKIDIISLDFMDKIGPLLYLYLAIPQMEPLLVY